MRRLFFILSTFLVTATSVLFGQVNYPVQVNMQLTPPYSLNLADYTRPEVDKLAANIMLKDITISELEVRFRLTIKRNNAVILQTRSDFMPPPTMIYGGENNRLTGYDLAPYFDLNNLQAQNISINNLARTGQLPEGFYEFQLEVLEYRRGLKISNTGSSMAWLMLNDPPFISLPEKGTKLDLQNPQYIVFQWTPRHTGSPNSAFVTEYEFTLFEIWPDDRPAEDAVRSQAPIYRATVNTTNLVYGPAEPMLIPGKSYAWRVQAKAKDGINTLDLFKNSGFSEAGYFTYGDACPPPTSISDTPSRQGFLAQWTPQAGNTGFVVRLREANKKGADWYEYDSFIEEYKAKGLKDSTLYEYEVRAVCGIAESEFIYGDTVLTQPAPPVNYSCGADYALADISNKTPLEQLQPGEIFTAGDFDVKVSTVSGGGGKFTGDGFVVVPFMDNLKIAVAFSQAEINEEYVLVGGQVNVTGAKVQAVPDYIRDEINSVIASVDSAFSYANQALDIAENAIEYANQADTLAVDGVIESIEVSNGQIVVTTTDGQTHTQDQNKDTIIKDSDNNTYIVRKNSNVAQKVNPNVLTPPSGVTDPAERVLFSKSDDQSFGFDKKTNYGPEESYERLELAGDYWVDWKSAAIGQSDEALVNLPGSDYKLYTLTDTLNTTNGPNGNRRVQVRAPGLAGLIEPVYAIKETNLGDSTAVQTAGKLNVIAYNNKTLNLNIVPLQEGGDISDLSASDVKRELDKIYKQAVVQFNVVKKQPFTTVDYDSDGDGLLKNSGSGPLASFTSEMRAVINAYEEAGEVAEGEYYLFVIHPGKTTNPSLSGYMPFNRHFGFIFLNTSNAQTFAKTAAHELGHGAFNLFHTFSEDGYNVAQGTTNNLMDYASGGQPGTRLLKDQWDKIHDPAPVLGGLQEDEESELLLLFEFESQVDGMPALGIGLTPLGQIIDEFPDDLNFKPVIIIKNTEESKYCIYGIRYNGIKYTWKANVEGASGYFNGNEELPISLSYRNSGRTKVYNYDNGSCYVTTHIIDWSNNVEDIQITIERKIEYLSGYPTLLKNADASCLFNYISDLNNSEKCRDVEFLRVKKDELIENFENSGDVSTTKISLSILSSCFDLLKQIDIDLRLKAFKKLSEDRLIGEVEENAIIALLNSFDTNQYKEVIDFIDDNNLIYNLCNQLHDKSINLLDENNYSNFFSWLNNVYQYNSEVVIDRFQAINLHDYNGILPFVRLKEKTINTHINVIEYDVVSEWTDINGDPKITIKNSIKQGSLIPTIEVGSFYLTPETGISPFTPILVDPSNAEFYVKEAIDNLEPNGQGVIMPAVFLTYYDQMKLNEAIEDGIITALDLITIYDGAPLIVANNLRKARRLYKIFEVSIASSNLLITTTNIENENLQSAVDGLDILITIFGSKNLLNGIDEYVTELKRINSPVIDAIENNTSIRQSLQVKIQEIEEKLQLAKNQNANSIKIDEVENSLNKFKKLIGEGADDLSTVNRIENLVNSLSDDAINLTDNVVNYSRNIENLSGQNYLDIIVHGEGADFIIDGQRYSSSDLGQLIRDLEGSDKPLRLLSCSDLNSAQELAVALNREIIANAGITRLYSNGEVRALAKNSTEEFIGWKKINSNGDVVEDIPAGTSINSGDDFILLGKNDNSWFDELPIALKSEIGDPASELGQYIKNNGPDGWEIASRLESHRRNTSILDKFKEISRRGRGINKQKLKSAIDSDLGDVLNNATNEELVSILNRIDQEHFTSSHLGEVKSRLGNIEYGIKQDLINNPDWFDTFDDVLQNPGRYWERISQGELVNGSALQSWAQGKWWKDLRETAQTFQNTAGLSKVRDVFGTSFGSQITLKVTKGSETFEIVADYLAKKDGMFYIVDTKYTTLDNFDLAKSFTPNQSKVFAWMKNGDDITVEIRAVDSRLEELDLFQGDLLDPNNLKIDIYKSVPGISSQVAPIINYK
ncbi:fibronectin type III domain-containing protein [Mangrovivirga sp. M17]|uniref:Fibronectin type III domain-containing protein n=1 Tax=Mangrovivirga halotolerans TaxID=2993936 RepID=A0ABT3RRJ3_9BACT|nr:fibronectin type III domain-containing protein [Mangrovivirga halotolerans]MCX2744398.1 fibronectin type III domain-containing protein [Mangrovivirga halotolerans]